MVKALLPKIFDEKMTRKCYVLLQVSWNNLTNDIVPLKVSASNFEGHASWPQEIKLVREIYICML